MITSTASRKNQLRLTKGNTAEHVTSYTIPSGTEVIIGNVAGGDAIQLYIDDYNILNKVEQIN